jgi:hypothetical protein
MDYVIWVPGKEAKNSLALAESVSVAVCLPVL